MSVSTVLSLASIVISVASILVSTRVDKKLRRIKLRRIGK